MAQREYDISKTRSLIIEAEIGSADIGETEFHGLIDTHSQDVVNVTSCILCVYSKDGYLLREVEVDPLDYMDPEELEELFM